MIKNEKNGEIEIDLWKLIKFYLQKWWIFVVCGMLTAGIALLYTLYFVTPQYNASVTIYVNNSKDSQGLESITGSNLTAAQKLVNTYVNIIKSNTVMNNVIEKGNLQCKPSDLREIMTAKQIDDTEMFTVSISHSDPTIAAHIANTIAEIAPKMISEFVEGSSTKIIDYAEVPVHPYTPSYSKNTVLGALIGIVIVGIALTVHHLMDVRIKTEEDLIQYFDAPVLGSIPSFLEAGKSHQAYGEYAYTSNGGKNNA